jgi:flagellar biosynthesis/type III secretory pathway protein FliH
MISSNASRSADVFRTPVMDPSAWMLQELRVPVELVPEVHHHETAEPADEIDHAAVAAAEQDRLIAEAYESGFVAGQLASANAAETQMRTVVDAVRAAAKQLVASEEAALGSLEDNLAALAVSVARQVIGREVRTSPEIIVDLVRLALTEFPIDQPLRIRINPLDLSTLSAATGNASIRVAPDREVTWIADARIIPGGCMVEGRQRIIDGRIDTALERAYRSLTQAGT